MADHPSISNPDFSTILLGWGENGPQFMPARTELVLLDTYYLSYFLVIVISWILFQFWRSRGSLKLWPWQIYDLAIITILGVLLGAKLFYVLFYFPEYYINNPLEIITNWSGMASHGALIGVTLGFWLYARRTKSNFLHIADHAVLGGIWAVLLVRLANFMNGELYGRSAGADWPFAMRFPMRDALGQPLYQDAGGQIFSAVLHKGPQRLEPLASELPRSHESFATIANQFPISDNPHLWINLPVGESGNYRQVVRLITDPSHPSQLYEAVLGGVILLIILWVIRFRAKLVGTVAGSFMVGYAAVRFIVEAFRQQDLQRSAGLFQWISMGQIFSICLALVGVAVLVHAKRRNQLISQLELPPRPVMPNPEPEASDPPTDPQE